MTKVANRYTITRWGKNYILLEDGYSIDEYDNRQVAERRARALNRSTVIGWTDRSVFVGPDNEDEEVRVG